MLIKEKLNLGPEETLRRDGSRSKGFMGETDITSYSILDASGIVVGSVEHAEHTVVNGFEVRNSLTQRDSLGKIVISVNW